MSLQIDELLKIYEYDIYNNLNVGTVEIKKIAEIISADKSIDLVECFDLLKCSSKFCWLNFLNILEILPKEDKIRGLPILFKLLQDSNWPTFSKTLKIFEEIDKEAIASCFNIYFAKAYAEDDEMWISNMQLLDKRLQINNYNSKKI